MSSIPPDGPHDELTRILDFLVTQEHAPARARDAAMALLVFADKIERAPGRPCDGPRRYRGRAVVPRHLHDTFCGWRIATRDDERPDLAWCSGCGLAVGIGAAGGQR